MKNLITLALLLIACSLYGAAEIVESEWPFLAGDYEVVGRRFDSDVAYAGFISIREEGKGFVVIRRIAGVEVIARGVVETVTPDQIPIFRIRFKADDIEYVGTYQFGTDLDNDGRFSGYLIPLAYTGSRPGKEVWFALKKSEKEPNKAVEPTPVAVTPGAEAPVAPSTSAAHLRR